MRYFILTGAAHPTDLRDRAAAHGEVIAVVAHRAPGRGCYGAVELRPTVSRANAGDRLPAGLPLAGDGGGELGAGVNSSAETQVATPAPGELNPTRVHPRFGA